MRGVACAHSNCVKGLPPSSATDGIADGDEVADNRQKEAENKRIAIQFLRNTDNRDSLHIMRVCLQPQVIAMHQLLADTDKSYDQSNMVAIMEGAAPKSRISSLCFPLAPGGIFHTQLRVAADLLMNTSHWSHLIPTEHLVACIFRNTLRPGAVLYELVVAKSWGFPFLLFSLLEKPESAGAVLKEALEKPCLVDSFSADFINAFPTAALLRSQDAQLILKTIATQVLTNTWSTERLHSSHSRRAQHRQQTHRVQMSDLAVFHAVHGSPPWLPAEVRSSKYHPNSLHTFVFGGEILLIMWLTA